MKQPETGLVVKMKDRLMAEGGWWVKIHGGPFQQAGIPDIIGCWKGRFIGIEAKMPGNGPSGIQKLTLTALEKSGARVGIAYTVKEALAIRDGEIKWSQQEENFS